MTPDHLVERARRGDRAATEELLAAHYDRVALICRRMTAGPHDADDATQEALIAIVAGLPRFDGRSAFSTWVHRVTVNACLDELRRRSRRLRLVDETASGRGALDGPDQRTDIGQVADRLDLDAALAALPEEFRVPVVLRDVLGYDYSDIAQLLVLPPGTVRSRIARGRGRLMALLDPGNQEGRRDVEHPGTPHHRPSPET